MAKIQRLGLIALVVIVAGCGASRTQIEQPPTPRPIDDIISPLEQTCVLSMPENGNGNEEDTITCTLPLFERAMYSLVDYWENIQFLQSQVGEISALGEVDKSVLTSERDQARADKWKWGAIGLGIGIAATLLTGGVVYLITD